MATAEIRVSFWRRFGYLVLLLALAPLTMLVFHPPADPAPMIDKSIEAHPELRTQVDEQFERVLRGRATIGSVIDLLPDRRVEGAAISRGSILPYVFAIASWGAFTLLVMFIFPKAWPKIPWLILAGLFTATFGLALLLGFQALAEIIQPIEIKYYNFVGLGMWIVKLIGQSYHLALDPRNGFWWSLLGFTFGVGFCEEICKALPVLAHYTFGRGNWTWRTACMMGMISGVGFGVGEGIKYCHDFYDGLMGEQIYLVRFISCVSLHAVWAGATGVLIFRKHEWLEDAGFFTWLFYVLIMIFVPMVLHGAYDTFEKKNMHLWSLGAAAASFVWLIIQVETARMEYGEREEVEAAVVG